MTIFLSSKSAAHHFDALPATQHFVLLPLRHQTEGFLVLLLLLLLRDGCLFLLGLLLDGRVVFFCLFLLLQLELKVLHVAFGSLMFRV